MNFKELLDSLTLEQAAAWDTSSEKILYIDNEICGPADCWLSDSRLKMVEERLEELLKNDHEEWVAAMAQMKADEDRWIDSGCPTNGFGNENVSDDFGRSYF